MPVFNLGDALLEQEVSHFLKSNTNPAVCQYEAVIEAGPHRFKALQVLSQTVTRHYHINVAEVRSITLLVGRGDYVHRVYPYREGVKIRLTKRQATKLSTDVYEAFLDTKNAPYAPTSVYANVDTETLNASGFFEITFQLVSTTYLTLNNSVAQGSLSDFTQPEALMAFMGPLLKAANVAAVEMHPLDRTDKRQNLILSGGIRVLHVPTYFQHNLGGLYSEGVGTFLQRVKGKEVLYIWPLYRTNLFNQAKSRVKLILAPEDKYPQAPCTYLDSTGTPQILITGPRSYKDQADNEFQNTGAGFKQANAQLFMNKPVDIDTPKPTALSLELTRQEQVNQTSRATTRLMSGAYISDNPYVARQSLAFKNTATLMVTWENANIDLITPGMPVSITLPVNQKLGTMQGTILSAQSHESLQGRVLSGSVLNCNAMLQIAVSREELSQLSSPKVLPLAIEAKPLIA